MLTRFVLAFLLMFAAPALAQDTPSTPALVRIVLTTSEGKITLALEKDRAPKTTANFLRYVDQRRLDGTTFYRAMFMPGGAGLIQGGPRGDPAKVLPPIGHEPTNETGITHKDGTVSLARLSRGTATADFFICVGDQPSLDANPEAPGDNHGFAAFGHVVDGMDVVRRILTSPTSPTEGEGVLKGQFLKPPVRILTARRVK